MEGSVSNVEVCNYAYNGQFEQLKQCILSDKTLACKADQVRVHDPVSTVWLFSVKSCLY